MSKFSILERIWDYKSRKIDTLEIEEFNNWILDIVDGTNYINKNS